MRQPSIPAPPGRHRYKAEYKAKRHLTEGLQMEKNITTVLVEPSSLLRDGLLRILSDAPFNVVADAAYLQDLQASFADGQPSLFILGGPLQDVAAVKARHPAARVVVLADKTEQNAMEDAICAGASAYLLKSISALGFVKSLELVMTDATVMLLSAPEAPAARTEMTAALHVAETAPSVQLQPIIATVHAPSTPKVGRQLSPREMCILNLLTDGASNKQIARKLDIAESTVKVHIKTILRKIQVKNRTQAAIWAMHKPETPADPPAETVQAPVTQQAPHLALRSNRVLPLIGAPRAVGADASWSEKRPGEERPLT